MAEPNNHAHRFIFTRQLPLADLCRQLDRISPARIRLGKFIERSIITETNLGLDEHDRTCPICQVPYHHERPVQLPCRHIFGHRCAARWLEQAKTCPTCRAKLESRQKVSFNLSILDPDRLNIFRRFLIFVIRHHGDAKGASLDRDFQALIRSRPKSPPEIDFTATKAPLWHDICWRRLHNWERRRNEFNSSALPKHLEDPHYEDHSPYRTFGIARGGVILPHENSAWFLEFGIKKTVREAWQTLRCRRMLHWIKGPWDGYEMEFLTMAVSQITKHNLDAFIHNDTIDLSLNDNPSSPWRLMDSRDYLEYRPNSGFTRLPAFALGDWLDTLNAN